MPARLLALVTATALLLTLAGPASAYATLTATAPALPTAELTERLLGGLSAGGYAEADATVQSTLTVGLDRLAGTGEVDVTEQAMAGTTPSTAALNAGHVAGLVAPIELYCHDDWHGCTDDDILYGVQDAVSNVGEGRFVAMFTATVGAPSTLDLSRQALTAAAAVHPPVGVPSHVVIAVAWAGQRQPVDAPAAPRVTTCDNRAFGAGLGCIPRAGTATLAWSAPSSGPAPDGYLVRFQRGTGDWQEVVVPADVSACTIDVRSPKAVPATGRARAASTTCTLVGFTVGQRAAWTVAAFRHDPQHPDARELWAVTAGVRANAAHSPLPFITSAFPKLLAPVTPGRASVRATGSGRVEVSFYVSEAAPLQPVDGYQLTVTAGTVTRTATVAQPAKVTDTTRRTASFSGLPVGAKVTVSIRAYNDTARSSARTTSGVVLGVPSAPRLTASVSGPGKVRVTVTPATAAGRTADRYTITRDGRAISTSSRTSLVDSGCKPGRRCTYTVVAHNAVGSSATRSVAVRAIDVPNAPKKVSASVSRRTVTLTVTPAATTARPVTRYEVLRDGKVVARSSSRTIRLTNQPVGKRTYQVRAVNDAGRGKARSVTVTVRR